MNEKSEQPEPHRTNIFDRVEAVVSGMDRAQELANRFKEMFSIFNLAAYFLAFLSFIGTYTGLRQLLASGDNNAGTLGFVGVLLFVLVMTFMMVGSLGRAIDSKYGVGQRISYFLTYLATMLFSVTFGFAFYWNLLEARSQAVGDAVAILSDFDRELAGVNYDLEQTKTALIITRDDFAARALAEADPEGGSQCGNSPGGPGPRARLMAKTSGDISAFVNQLEPNISRVVAANETVSQKIKDVRALGRAQSEDTNTDLREDLFAEASEDAREAAVAVSGLANDAAIKSTITQYRELASKFASTSDVWVNDRVATQTFVCTNTSAANNLRAVADRLAALPELDTPPLNTFSGALATREAVGRFMSSISSPLGWLLPDEDTEPSSNQQVDAAAREKFRAYLEQAGESDPRDIEKQLAEMNKPGLRTADFGPLILALFIDGLLFLSVFWSRPAQKFGAFMALVREASNTDDTPIDVISRAEGLQTNQNWRFIEPYLFSKAGRTYLAQPLDRRTREGAAFFNIIIMFQRSKLIVKSRMSQKEIRAQLELVGSEAVSNKSQKFQAWAFRGNNFEHIIEHEVLRPDQDDVNKSPQSDEEAPKS